MSAAKQTINKNFDSVQSPVFERMLKGECKACKEKCHSNTLSCYVNIHEVHHRLQKDFGFRLD